MSKKFLMTAFSKDRPGIVADISQVIFENGCTLEDSAMTNLSDEFALILLFSPLSSDQANDLEERLSAECRRLERDKGISAFIRPVEVQAPAQAVADTYSKQIEVEGFDQAGIVYKVSRFLADNNINITRLNSRVSHSPESGAAIYQMDVSVDIPNRISMDTLEDGLGTIGDELHVDIHVV
jgi:glycine cleavage system transcriptional repressor